MHPAAWICLTFAAVLLAYLGLRWLASWAGALRAGPMGLDRND